MDNEHEWAEMDNDDKRERDEMDNAAREMVEYDNELETLCARVLIPTWYHDYDEPHAECAVHVIDTLAHTLSRDDVSPMYIRTALVLALGTIDHLLNANDGL